MFEVIVDGSAGQYHDSVDAFHHSNDLPIGFNVLDFQGKFSNKDYKLIGDLLTHMPSIYLLVQVTEPSYITDVLSKLDEEIRNRFSKRVLVITKNADEDTLYEIKEALREIFEDFDDEKQMKDLGKSFSGDKATYESDCREILERLRNEIEAQANFYELELNDLKAKMKLANKTLSTHEYEHIYGTYWLLTDSMQAMSKGSECQVLT